MPFNSLHFAAFFAVLAILYFLTRGTRRWMVLLSASVVFYLWPDAGRRYGLFIAGFVLINYWLAIRIAGETSKGGKTRYLVVGLVANIGSLAVLKYLGFFSEAVALITGTSSGAYSVVGLIVPLGLSFLTFRVLSYLIDVYRGQIQPETHLGYFALYVLFFPQVMAGPIQRAGSLLPQLRQRVGIDYDRITDGLKLIVWGLFKKVVIADRLAVFVGQVYNHPQDQSGLSFLVATYFYAIQIYCDFSGYTDIAIGCGRILGFQLPDNFDRPYFARSIADFWRRWHITLSTWLRDYVYIPMGGSRVTTLRHVANLLAVFLLCGLWHGAGWTFLVWGGLHGVYLGASVLTKDLRRTLSTALFRQASAPRVLQQIIAFHLVCFAWIFFRSANLSDASFISSNVLWPSADVSWIVSIFHGVDFWIAMFAIGLLALVEIGQQSRPFLEFVNTRPVALRWGVTYVVLFSIMFFGVYDKQDFIYFQF